MIKYKVTLLDLQISKNSIGYYLFITFLICFALLGFTPKLEAQSVNLSDGACVLSANLTLEVTPHNGKNYYTNSGAALALYWDSIEMRWEVHAGGTTPPPSGDNTLIAWFSNTNTSPNPPDLATGNWQTTGLGCNPLTQLDGDGTQGACSAGTTAPPLSSTTASNTCPATTVDLDALHTGTVPTGTTLVWSTDNDASDGLSSTEASPTSNAGTYYAYYFDSANSCYSPASAGVVVTLNTGEPRLVSVDPTNNLIIIENCSTCPIDITSWRLCSKFSYIGISTGMVTSGSLSLGANGTVTLNLSLLDATGGDLGLYIPSGSFGDPAAMEDFTQWLSGGNGRESVAVAKGIWVAGDFLTCTGVYTRSDCSMNMLAAWTSPSPPTIPTTTVDNNPVCQSGTGTPTTATFTANGGAAAPAGFNYQWALDGTDIGGETNATLTGQSTLGTYTVYLTDGAGCDSGISTGIVLTNQVCCDLTITTQPTNQTECAGDDATFTVAATSSATTINYQWQQVCPSTTFTNYTTDEGIGNNHTRDVYVSNGTIYVATSGGGVSISMDGGSTWTSYTNAEGLGHNTVYGIYESGGTIYAATLGGGLSISMDGGTSWTIYTTSEGLGHDNVRAVYVSGGTIYAATLGGLSISSDGGTTWTNYIDTDGLGSNAVLGVYESGGTIYAATSGGVSISSDGGTTWANYTTADGLINNGINSVYESGGTIYAATQGGLSISMDGGTSWTNYTTGMVATPFFNVYESGGTIYVGGNGGISTSSDGGSTWTNYTTADGLGNNATVSVYESGGTLYAATIGGLSILGDVVTNVGTNSATYTFTPTLPQDTMCTYQVVVTDSKGCSVTSDVADLTVNGTPSIAAIATQSTTCPATTYDLSTVTVTDNNSIAGTTTTFHSVAPTSATDMSNQLGSNIISADQTVFVMVANTTTGCFDVESFMVDIVACCEITSFNIGTPVQCGNTGTYGVDVTWVGGFDASVSLVDANATFTGDDPATVANGTATLIYNIGTDANVAINDSESLCSFSNLTATSPTVTPVNYMETDGDCTAPPQITLPAGYTCTYEYLVGGTHAGNTGSGGVATYPAALVDGDSGTVEFTITTPCGNTEVVQANFFCIICGADSGSWTTP